VTTLKLFDNISRKTDVLPKLGYGLFWLALFVASLGAGKNAYAATICDGKQDILAQVVVLDNPTVFNRLGAQNPNWITYALRRDVVVRSDQGAHTAGTPLNLIADGDIPSLAGNVELRGDKRPRPLVIRGVEGACLTVKFTNLLTSLANQRDPIQGRDTIGVLEPTPAKAFDGLDNNDQTAGRCASFHATGTELVVDMNDDGSMVGANPGANAGPTDAGQSNCGTGMVAPGDPTITYNLYTPHEGAFIINSYGAPIGSESNSGNLAVGMFGALNVQPKRARMYRSQVTEEEMRLATARYTAAGQPVIDYEALYPDASPWTEEGKANLPVINMQCNDAAVSKGACVKDELLHSDINAIIAGDNKDGTFKSDTYPLESQGKINPQLPNRLEPFREFTSQFHDEQTNSQAFPNWYNHPVMRHVLHGVKDQFMINYGSGGIGSEIISNRLRTGPMHDCTDCAYEEFFLASQTVGDPALLVNSPANTGIEACHPEGIAAPAIPNPLGDGNDCWRDPLLANGPIPNNYALYQEDPSNVHHTYPGDFVKMRNTHAGAFEQHIFHFHNHQWLFNPNDDNGNYLDAQEIMPGSGHTYELVNRGAGNRNSTTGDAIFHCHFYPHFAQGMWYHMRIHDVYETGTVLAVSGVGQANAQKAPLWHESLDANDDGFKDDFHKGAWDLRSGQPMAGSRAYPDGELLDGSPIPAIVPLPGKPMPPMPAEASVIAVDRGDFALLAGREPPESLCTNPDNPGPDGEPGTADDFCGVLNQGADSSQAVVNREDCENGRMCAAGPDGVLWDDPLTPEDETADNRTPGYPFWLAGNECGPNADPANGICPMGIVGQRMPTPPLDMLTEAGAAAVSPVIANPLCVAEDPMDPNGCLDANDEKIPAEIKTWENLGGGWDGGLPRHALLGYTAGGLSLDTQNRFDFRKIVEMSQPVYFPELGTDLERISMAYQAQREHPSSAVDLDKAAGGNIVVTPANFVLNGAPPVPGAPFNDPCIDDQGDSLDGTPGQWWDGDPAEGTYVNGSSPYTAYNPRTYKLANLQIDAVFNKVGYHYSQERIIILWEDITPTVLKERPPEPLVMRFNTFDCGKILHANLVPSEFELDDFQVRTPTDIIGQHIHLPKWDLTSNDGAANGWNYEDGTLSPMMVVERIHAIERYNSFAGQLVGPNCTLVAGLAKDKTLCPIPGQIAPLDLTGLAPINTLTEGIDPGAPSAQYAGTPELHPVDHYDTAIADGANPQFSTTDMYLGARTTIQRILVDPVLNVAGVDRGLGLTFSHDHYGPSTFQQIGLYSTILAEPAGSTWVHNETGTPLNTRADGGPTTWQAAILTGSNSPSFGDYSGATAVSADKVPDHREFYFEMSDFQHAYEAGIENIGADAFGIPVPAQHDFATTVTDNIADVFNATKAKAPAVLEKSWLQAVNPTLKLTAGGGDATKAFPDTVNAQKNCPGRLGQNDLNYPRPCPEAINIGHSSMWVVNYRNEPVGLRVFDPSADGPDVDENGNPRSGRQTAGPAGDLALAFQSRGDRAISELNSSFGNTPYPQASYCQGKGDGINCDRGNGDPFTPIMRAYMNDQVKVKIQVGATEEQHQTTIHGMKWLSNGSGFGRSGNSGWRNFQSHGISEQFSLQVPITQDPDQPNTTVDYLYAQDATRDGIWSGTWGILRAYQSRQQDLLELPNNPQRGGGFRFRNEGEFLGVCPRGVNPRNGKFTNEPANLVAYNVYAVLANDVLGNDIDLDGNGVGDIMIPPNTNPTDNVGGPLNPDGGTLVYNRRAPQITIGCSVPVAEGEACPADDQIKKSGPINDPTAMMYVLEEDLQPRTGFEDRCSEPNSDGGVDINMQLEGCPVELKPNVPVEPLVLRASAGDCVEVTLHNKLLDQAMAGGSAVYYCDDTDLDGLCDNPDAAAWSHIFDAAQAQDSLDNGQLLVNADGVQVAMAAIKFDSVPDLAGWQDTFWVVNRDLEKPVNLRNQDQMSFFGNNLIAPSGQAGLVAQLVDYDARTDQGVQVGRNSVNSLAVPGGKKTYRYYAGDVSTEEVGVQGNATLVDYVATPIEFGGSNLLSADRIKQPQKGLFGALVIEPMGATVTEDTVVPDGQGMGSETRPTRAQVSVSAPAGDAGSGGDYRETVLVAHKITNLRWADGSAVKNVAQAEFGVEGAEDSGHAGFNYGMEPPWFRFGLAPDADFGAAGTPNSYGNLPNPQAMYSNKLVEGQPNVIPNNGNVSVLGDPQTPVFRAQRDATDANSVFDTRMFVLNGASADRDSTYILHGHVWQRDPHVCTGTANTETHRSRQDATLPGLPGRCDPWAEVPSNALGLNKQAKYMGGEEGMGHVFAHWPILFDAGGTGHIKGDYLFRDYAPNGNRNGMFGILRVTDGPAGNKTDEDAGAGGGGNDKKRGKKN
jgi:hypothetical protein